MKTLKERMLKQTRCLGKIKASEIGTKEEMDRIKRVIKMFNGTVTGVFEIK